MLKRIIDIVLIRVKDPGIVKPSSNDTICISD